ncbi:MAG: PHP domain-containing protein [Athalassotoga sp.]|uniref:PHP domain-containing protein n=1 Tax=Athalassotoga sp. TaxID=2022597 RepID=UPI003D04B496
MITGDFHVHTCLSPCADITMVPNEMAKRFSYHGIEWIGITDHNTCGNVKVFERVFSKYGITVLPGIEVQSVEEVHVLGYFESVETAEEFSKVIYSHLPDIKNDPERFGYQLFVDEEDHFTGTEEKILASSTDLHLDELFKLIKAFKGLFVYAHVERTFGVLKQLGFIPDNPPYDALETIRKIKSDKAILKSSDAHTLDQIGTSVVKVGVNHRTFEEFKRALERRLVFIDEDNSRSYS